MSFQGDLWLHPLFQRCRKTSNRELLDDLNHLSTAEIKFFCKQHSIPNTIAIETKDGYR